MATITKRGKSYILQWSENGKQFRRSIGAIQRAEAEKARLNKEVELGQSTLSPFFDYFAAEYLDWYAAQFPASFDRTRQIIVDRLSPHFKEFTLAQINGRAVKDYQISRQSVATGTYLKEYRCLQAMLNRAVEWEYIDTNPIKHIKPPKDNNSKPPHFYTTDELEMIYKAASSRNKDLEHYRWQWQFMAYTGMRLGEAMKFTKSDVTENTIIIKSSDEARTKSGKWREIPLFNPAREALNHLDDKLFTIADKSVSRAFKRDLRACGLEGSLHSLRHTFISHLAMTGKFSMTEIKNWAGHSSVVTTQRYQHLIPHYNRVDLSALDVR